MTKKLKAVLYGILPFLMIVLCASMITYIFAATKSELLITGKIGYEVQKGTGTEEDPFLIYSVGPNDGTAKQGTFNFYAGNNAEGKNYFASTSPQYYFKQANDISGSNSTQTTLNGFYDGNNYEFDASGGGALFSSIGTSSVTDSTLYDLDVINYNSTATAGVATTLYGTLEGVTFDGSINSTSTGMVAGLVGTGYGNITLTNCANFADITATNGTVVGLIGLTLSSPGSTGYIDSDLELIGCYNKGDLTGKNVYGLADVSYATPSFVECYNSGELNATSSAYGFVPGNYGGSTFSNCYNIGNVTAGTYASGFTSGSGGQNRFENCYNTGDIISTSTTTGSAGGFCKGGGTGEYLSNCYNTGTISGYKACGLSFGGGSLTIAHCYNSGEVIGTNSAYALAEVSGVGTVSWSYNIGNVSVTAAGNSAYVIYASNASAVNTTAVYYLSNCGATKFGAEESKTLSQLQSQSTYSGWTFGTYGTATEGWCMVPAEILVNGEVQKLVLPRLAWEDLEVLDTYSVTLNANGGKLGTKLVREIPDNISYVNSKGFTQNSTLQYTGSVSGTTATYAMIKISFTANAGDIIKLTYTFTKGTYGTVYMYLSSLNSKFTASASTESSYAVRKTATSSNQTQSYSITSSGTNYFYAKIYKAYYSTSYTSTLSFTLTQTSETEDITSITTNVCEGGYVSLNGAERDYAVLLGVATSSSATTPTYPIQDNNVYITSGGTYYLIWKITATSCTICGGDGICTGYNVVSASTASYSCPTGCGGTAYEFSLYCGCDGAHSTAYGGGARCSNSCGFGGGGSINSHPCANCDGTGFIEDSSGSGSTETYSISFNANGGSGEMNSVDCNKGSSITLPENIFTNSGYNFIGWATSASGSVIYQPSATITPSSDLVLYAKYTSAVVSVACNACGGDGICTGYQAYTQTYNAGSCPAYCGGTVTGYVLFCGCDGSQHGGGIRCSGYASCGVVDEATMDSHRCGRCGGSGGGTAVPYYTVSFSSNGGSGSMSSLSIYAGTAGTIPSCTFTKSGYEFVGWAKTSTGEVRYNNGDKIVPTITITLYAIWRSTGGSTNSCTDCGGDGICDPHDVTVSNTGGGRCPAGCGGSVSYATLTCACGFSQSVASCGTSGCAFNAGQTTYIPSHTCGTCGGDGIIDN